jgi:hypothetical protein
MAKIRGMKVALFTGLVAVVALIAFSVVFWKELLIRYYEMELGRDCSHIIPFLREPPSSAKRLALSRFFVTQNGKKSLVKKYLEACIAADGTFKERIERMRTSELKTWLLTWTSSGKYNHMTYTDMPGWSFRGSGGGGGLGSKIFEGEQLATVLEALQNSMLEVEFDRFSIPDDPLLTISVVTRGDEEGIWGGRMLWHSFPGGRLCLIERVDRQWPRRSQDSESSLDQSSSMLDTEKAGSQDGTQR